MAKRQTVGGSIPVTVTGVQRGLGGGLPKPGRTDGGASPPREPAQPPYLSEAPRTEFVFATVGGVLRLPSVGIGKVTGGTPQVTETDVVGRVTGTNMADRTRRSVELPIGLYGRLTGESVQPIVAALFGAAVAGRLVRLYGPLNRPGCEGVAWVLNEPSFDDAGLNAARKLNHAKMTITLGEWTPLDGIVSRKAGSAAKRTRQALANVEGSGTSLGLGIGLTVS